MKSKRRRMGRADEPWNRNKPKGLAMPRRLADTPGQLLIPFSESVKRDRQKRE
jgi:hypothetical protein